MLLKKGMKGLSVVRLQCQLKQMECHDEQITGEFDDVTHTSVMMFQTLFDLTVDGLAGNNTNARLKKETKNAFFALFIHCSATKEGHDLGPDWVVNLHTVKKGWSRPGYSDVITLDGKLHNIRKWDSDNNISDWEYSFGVKGSTLLNRNSRHVVYMGGVAEDGRTAKDTRTKEQLKSLETYIRFTVLQNPNIIVLGHNQVQRKACPSFYVPDYLKKIGIPSKNIAEFTHYKK